MTASRVVLVTGASGFIGRWSVPPLLASGFQVHVVVSPHRPAPRDIPEELRGADVHAADLLDPCTAERLLQLVKPTHLLHFAWIATPGIYWESIENYRWVEASLRLLWAFRELGGERAVVAGSCAEYDWSQASLCNEIMTPLAIEASSEVSAYATCKCALQKLLSAYSRGSGLKSAWGRVFFQYGPNEGPDRLVASLIRKLLAGEEAHCLNGSLIRTFLHVSDVGAAFAALVDSTVQGLVNIGSAEQVSLAQLAILIGKKTDRLDLLRIEDAVPSLKNPAILVPDTTRLSKELGWHPRYSLTEGITSTVAWWRRRLRLD